MKTIQQRKQVRYSISFKQMIVKEVEEGGCFNFIRKKYDIAGRINIVVTTKTDWHPENVFVTHTIDEAIAKAKESDAKEIFIIGGGEIFKQTIEIVNRIYITRVHTTVEGDTSYPEIDTSQWKQTKAESFPADEKNNYPYTFEVWDKIDKA